MAAKQFYRLLSPLLALLLAGLCLPITIQAAGLYWDFPPLPPPYQYGNVLINRISSKNGVKPVYFSHWSHRVKYSCRVCHFELQFAFGVNQTPITEEDNRHGLYCGACHNGKAAFGPTPKNCHRCHTGTIALDRDKFLALARRLPRSAFGNKIDWVQAVAKGLIHPRFSIFRKNEKPFAFDERLRLAARWNFVPPAIFSHATHNPWLDCANCHPDVFNIKKKTTKHFAMRYILQRKFCGVCHLDVAFPLNDCNGCHPKIPRRIK